MVLAKLFEEMGAKEQFDKTVITAMVYDTLRSNKCGVNSENEDAVKNALVKDVCSRYELEVLLLSAYWASDLCDLLVNHLQLTGDVYKDYIWKFLRENEVYPNVKMGA